MTEWKVVCVIPPLVLPTGPDGVVASDIIRRRIIVTDAYGSMLDDYEVPVPPTVEGGYDSSNPPLTPERTYNSDASQPIRLYIDDTGRGEVVSDRSPPLELYLSDVVVTPAQPGALALAPGYPQRVF